MTPKKLAKSMTQHSKGWKVPQQRSFNAHFANEKAIKLSPKMQRQQSGFNTTRIGILEELKKVNQTAIELSRTRQAHNNLGNATKRTGKIR